MFTVQELGLVSELLSNADIKASLSLRTANMLESIIKRVNEEKDGLQTETEKPIVEEKTE